MRVGIWIGLIIILLLAVVLKASAWAINSENLVVIKEGPINFSSEKRQYTINFEVTEDQISDCKTFYIFVGVRSLIKGKFFSCRSYINGRFTGGAGTSSMSWHIGGSGSRGSCTQVEAGTNQIVLESTQDKTDGPCTFDGQAAGIVLYFSKDENEDIGLLDYIPYSLVNQGFWVAGKVHEHTVDSDGSPTVKESSKKAKDLNYDFVIFANHYEQIDKPVKAPGLYYNWATSPVKVAVGFANYIKSCQNETHNGSFVAIAGAEINTPWHLDSKTNCFAHTLCLGSIQKTDVLNKAQGKEGKQAEVIAAINKIGLSVAAHPNLTSFYSVSTTPWEGIHFRYDLSSKSKYAGINGVEIGNTVTPSQDDADMAFFMKLMKEHYPAFPTGGCDNHGWGDKDDAKRSSRLTGVFVDELTENGILKGLKRGSVYASIEGIRITNCNPVPDFSIQNTDKARFFFTLSGLPQKVMCQMYRDGEPISASKKTISPGSPIYTWTDENGPKKECWYNFRVLPNFLVTAPIIYKIGY